MEAVKKRPIISAPKLAESRHYKIYFRKEIYLPYQSYIMRCNYTQRQLDLIFICHNLHVPKHISRDKQFGLEARQLSRYISDVSSDSRQFFLWFENLNTPLIE